MNARFPSYVGEILLNAGWFPGRDVDLGALPRDFVIFAEAEKALREFGGLGFKAPGRGLECGKCFVLLEPYSTEGMGAEVGLLAPSAGRVYPIAELDMGQGYLFIDEEGMVYLFVDSLEYYGCSVDQALIQMTLGLGPDSPRSWDPVPDDWLPPTHAMIYLGSEWRAFKTL